MEVLFLLLILVLVPVLAVIGWQYSSTRSVVSDRLRESGLDDSALGDFRAESMVTLVGIRGWLFRAGFRHPLATPIFWVSTVSLFVLGILIWFQLYRGGTIDIAADFIRSIPGGVGNVMVPFALATPWVLIVVLTLVPTLVVRSVRRKRVQEVEQDLPLFLDLLNTLSQAGIGFDAALDRILGAQSSNRPLVSELRTFQADNLAGRSRVDSLKRLMRRVDVPMFSTFISAIVQAEQVGAGIGDTLKVQAVEMRARRREKAAAAAMSVPTLLVMPMVIGFLPGIFVVLLGPMIFEAFAAMGQTLRGVSGQ